MPAPSGALLDDATQRIGRLFAAGELRAAEIVCRQLLERQPDHFGALHALGAVHAKRGQFAEAERFIARALEIDGTSPLAWNGHGSALRGLKRLDEALTSYRRAIALKPDFAQAFYNLAGVMHELGRLDDALANYDKALALQPGYVRALFNRGGVLQELGRLAEALDSYDKVIALDPGNAGAFNSRGIVLTKLGDMEGALASHDRALALDPNHEQAPIFAMAAAGQLCDWRERRRRHADAKRLLDSGKPVVPFPLLPELDSPAIHLKAAASFWRSITAGSEHKVHAPVTSRGKRLRLAYVSADFCDHPVAYAVAELFELHDREQFEVYAVSLNSDDGSPIRKRLAAAVDHFVEAETKSDDAIAAKLADTGIAIVVDLTGHTRGQRPAIFARRPAAIAVNYLGYPGTSGADCMDYIIADPYVIPKGAEVHYSEKIAYLPHSYFISDSRRGASANSASRTSNGLPESGFVFCCFNNAFKITPEVLTVWARILKGVEHSVLWLNVWNPAAQKNLRREIEARGVPAARLVFAPFLSDLGEHLARLSHADLFLDTLPYNAHSTACDALFAGVPVLTCSGQSFAARVGGSLLNAVGLPELITSTAEDYEALALTLAHDPSLLSGIRQKLAVNRSAYPLFNSNLTRLHLEAAYRTMWDRYCGGLSPHTFLVEPFSG